MAFSRLRASVARIDGRFAGGFLRAEGVAFLVIETVQGINIGLGAGDNDVRVGTHARPSRLIVTLVGVFRVP